MKASELRIGNYINEVEDGLIIVNSIDSREHRFYVTDQNGDINGEDFIEPIPLTEEWFVKFGFDSDPYQDMYVLGWLKINCDKTRGGLELWVENITGNVVYLQHVHSLQNLYFALTGEELTYQNK